MSVTGIFVNATTKVSKAAGETIFGIGEPGTEMYGVIDGSVELRKGGTTLASLGPGTVFGEMALIDRSPRSLDAVAVTATELAVIDRPTFLWLIDMTPTFALDVMGALAARLRDYDASLEG